jgi:hypothetical protein
LLQVIYRFSKELTHIIFKNGRPTTLHRYHAMPQPKPLLVGIGWVVRCKEVHEKIEEKEFIVEASKEAVYQKRKIIVPRIRAPAGSRTVNAGPPTESVSSRLSLSAWLTLA